MDRAWGKGRWKDFPEKESDPELHTVQDFRWRAQNGKQTYFEYLVCVLALCQVLS